MLFPSKIVSYENSIISKLPILLESIENGETDVLNLYKMNKCHFDDINDYIYALDILFLLDKIDVI